MNSISDSLLFDLRQIKSFSPAIIYHDKNLRADFNELNKIILNKICYLLDNNILPGSNVVLRVRDPWVDLQYFLALTYIGVGVYCPLGNSESEKEVVRCIGAESTVSDSFDFEVTKFIIDSGGLCSVGMNKSFEEIENKYDLQNHLFTWLIRSSSGTTGVPKIFKLYRTDLLSRRQRYYDAVGIQSGDLFYSLTPTRFGAARQRIYYSLTAGAAVLFINEGTDLSEIIKLINSYKVTHLYCVPIHLEALCKYAENNKHSMGLLFPYLKSLETTSSLVSPVLREKVIKLLTPNFVIAYSVSEIGHITSTRKSEISDFSVNDIGSPVYGVDVGIYNASNIKLKNDMVGRIGVQLSDGCFNGYFNTSDSEEGKNINNVFFPGDLGYISKNNNIIFKGREDDMMIYNGINIYPYEIELALKSLTEVIDAVAFPLPSKIHYQIPCAAVILDKKSDADYLISKCSQLIGPRSPRLIFFLNEFPRNHMGKVLRKELQRLAVEHMQSRK